MTTDVKEAIRELNEAWSEFKKTNNDRLKTIEQNGSEFSEHKEKLDKIEKHMDELEEVKSRLEKAELKLDTPEFSKGKEGKLEAEHMKAFEDMVRSVKMGDKTFGREKEAALLEAQANINKR